MFMNTPKSRRASPYIICSLLQPFLQPSWPPCQCSLFCLNFILISTHTYFIKACDINRVTAVPSQAILTPLIQTQDKALGAHFSTADAQIFQFQPPIWVVKIRYLNRRLPCEILFLDQIFVCQCSFSTCIVCILCRINARTLATVVTNLSTTNSFCITTLETSSFCHLFIMIITLLCVCLLHIPIH